MRAPLHGQRRYTFPRRRGHRRHCLPSLDHTAASPSGSTRADKDWEPMWALSREGPRRRAGDGPRRHASPLPDPRRAADGVANARASPAAPLVLLLHTRAAPAS
jgi:hypothetical protein